MSVLESMMLPAALFCPPVGERNIAERVREKCVILIRTNGVELSILKSRAHLEDHCERRCGRETFSERHCGGNDEQKESSIYQPALLSYA